MNKIRSKIDGFTLLEVLVTLVIMSIGLLGLASLQLRSLQYTHASYQRTLASIYAKDMAERMWTNLKNPTSVTAPTLPSGWTMTVTRTAVTVPAYPNYISPDTYDITVTWTDERFGSSSSSFRDRVRLMRVAP